MVQNSQPGDLERNFREVQEMGKLGYWRWNIETGEVMWTTGVYRIFHLDPETFIPQIDSIMAMSPWEDSKNRHLEIIDLIKKGSDQRSFEQRFQRPDGSIGYYASTIEGEFDDHGTLSFIKGILQDVSEKRLMEQALHESEEKYRTLFETMVQGVIYQDSEGQIISANPAAERILGLSIKQMKGRFSGDPRWRSIREDGSEYRSDSHPAMVALKTRKPVTDSVMGIYNPQIKDITWININAVPQFLPGEEEPYQVYTTIEDISERKQTLQELNMARFSIDKASVAIFWMNREGIFTYVNDAACRSLGYTRDELQKLHLWEIDPLYPKDRWELNWNQYRKMGNGFQHLESLQKRKNGETFPVEIFSEHHWFDNIEFHVAFARDITERKLIMESLRESEMRFRIIYEQAAVGVAQVMTLTGQFVRMNKKYCKIIGYSERETLTMNFQDITHPEDLQEDLDHMEKLKAGEIREYSMEKRYIRKDGSTVWVNLTVSPMWMPGETPNYHIGIVEDITIRKRADAKIKKSEQLLQETNASKDKLFTIISHDLRSPFNAIIGFSDLLLKKYHDLDEKGRLNFIEEIHNNSKRAYFLLDNLLNWALEQRGKIVINKKRHKIGQMVTDSIQPYLSLASNKTLEIRTDIPEDMTFKADENTMKTVIGNLFSNAIKFTKSGGKISILAFRKKTSVELIIRDTGEGMRPETIDRILNADEIQPTPGTNNEAGTGLGLQLCRDFIERNEGILQIESTPGKGSSFIISLPD